MVAHVQMEIVYQGLSSMQSRYEFYVMYEIFVVLGLIFLLSIVMVQSESSNRHSDHHIRKHIINRYSLDFNTL